MGLGTEAFTDRKVQRALSDGFAADLISLKKMSKKKKRFFFSMTPDDQLEPDLATHTERTPEWNEAHRFPGTYSEDLAPGAFQNFHRGVYETSLTNRRREQGTKPPDNSDTCHRPPGPAWAP